jgi:tetratricopeptide (TPR) repeat protein
LKISPDKAHLHYDLAVALKFKDDLAGAVGELKEAIRLDPELADAYYTYGVTLWQTGDFPAAVEQLQDAIRVKPDYAEAFYTLGTVLKQMNKLPEAANALREAIRLQPDFAGAHTTLAAVLRQLGDTQGAALESRTGAEISQQKTSLQAATFTTNSGRRLLEAGDLEGAISQFRSAINSQPTYAPAHYELGLALQRKGDKAGAAAEFQKVGELDSRFKSPSE